MQQKSIELTQQFKQKGTHCFFVNVNIEEKEKLMQPVQKFIQTF